LAETLALAVLLRASLPFWAVSFFAARGFGNGSGMLILGPELLEGVGRRSSGGVLGLEEGTLMSTLDDPKFWFLLTQKSWSLVSLPSQLDPQPSPERAGDVKRMAARLRSRRRDNRIDPDFILVLTSTIPATLQAMALNLALQRRQMSNQARRMKVSDHWPRYSK
jgi:hypothetical protein